MFDVSCSGCYFSKYMLEQHDADGSTPWYAAHTGFTGMALNFGFWTLNGVDPCNGALCALRGSVGWKHPRIMEE